MTLHEYTDRLGGLCRTESNIEGLQYQKGAHVLATDEGWILDIFRAVLPMQEVDYKVAINPLLDLQYYTFPFDKEAVEMMPWHWSEAAKKDLEGVKGETAANVEDLVVNFYGQTLYDKFYSSYLRKMFGFKDPKTILATDWMRRNLRPVEDKSRYFTERTWFPVGRGYNDLFDYLTEGVEVVFNSAPRAKDIPRESIVVCAGRPQWLQDDVRLEYTGLTFDIDSARYLPTKPDTVIYPFCTPFISISQFGKFFPDHSKNVIVKDVPSVDCGEASYPILNAENIGRFERIRAMNPQAYFIGRTGSFQILTMAECVKQAAVVAAEINRGRS